MDILTGQMLVDKLIIFQMKKITNSMKKIGKYFREVSIIVIGVAITLFSSYWITNRSEKRDMALYLSAVKLELEENVGILDETNSNSIQPAVKYSDYLRSHNKKSLNLDSLTYYREKTAFNAYTITFKTNAFEMFKISGNMRLMQNKELVLSLWNTYAKLDEVKQGFDEIRQMKIEEMKQYFYLNSLPDEELLKNPTMYNFYVNMFAPYTQEGMCKNTRIMLNETISKFE